MDGSRTFEVPHNRNTAIEQNRRRLDFPDQQARTADFHRQRIVACSDTRGDLEIEFRVWDAQTNQTASRGRAVAASDAVTVLAAIAASAAAKRFYLLEWSGDAPRKLQGRNHYLSSLAPFDAADYCRWLHNV